MSFTGMNIQEVRQLASEFNRRADEIDQLCSALTNQLSSANWVGPDRENFHSEWTGQYTSALTGVANGLRDAGSAANRNADQQEQASNA